MRIHLIGGLSDGEVIDTEDPDSPWSWSDEDFPGNMLPETLTCHACRANRTVYRLVRADGDEGWYQVDVELTRLERAGAPNR